MVAVDTVLPQGPTSTTQHGQYASCSLLQEEFLVANNFYSILQILGIFYNNLILYVNLFPLSISNNVESWLIIILVILLSQE